ncbi:MAG: hypothetical protein AAGO57_06875, partial [Pseudomonadota bacterium]
MFNPFAFSNHVMGWFLFGLGLVVVAGLGFLAFQRRHLIGKWSRRQVTEYRTATLVLGYATVLAPIWAFLLYYVAEGFWGRTRIGKRPRRGGQA